MYTLNGNNKLKVHNLAYIIDAPTNVMRVSQALIRVPTKVNKVHKVSQWLCFPNLNNALYLHVSALFHEYIYEKWLKHSARSSSRQLCPKYKHTKPKKSQGTDTERNLNCNLQKNSATAKMLVEVQLLGG